MSTTVTEPSSAPVKPQVGLVLSVVLVMFGCQMIINPIVPALSRDLGLAEWQIGLMISSAAFTIMIASQFWGRKSVSWGRKPVLVTVTFLAGAASAVFALVSWLGMVGLVTGVALFGLLVLFRGVVFGAAMSAVIPTAMAYIADITPTEKERVKGMAGVGAMQGIAMVVGSLTGGLLAAMGLLTPLIAVPFIIFTAAVLISVRLRPDSSAELVRNPPRISPLDSRVWPFLLAGLGMFTALGFVQIITGFLVLDRYSTDTRHGALLTGVALLFAGLGTLTSQVGIVRRVDWRPSRLLRIGCSVALVGYVLMAMDISYPLFVAGVYLSGTGFGLAMPGYTAGPSLLMNKAEQGGMAGLINANNALTFIIAPTLATALYGVWAPLPMLVAAGFMATVIVFLWTHPRFKRAPTVPTVGV